MRRIHGVVLAAGLLALFAIASNGTLRVPFWIKPADSPAPDICVLPRFVKPVAAVVGPVVGPVANPLDSHLIQLSLAPDHRRVHPSPDGHVFVHVSLTGAENASPQRQASPSSPPVDLILVIDRSGSMMARGKLDYARSAAKIAGKNLGPEDRIALITFDQVSRVIRPLAPLTDRDAYDATVNSIQPGGSTNLYQGLKDGGDQLQGDGRGNRVRRILLLTDGLASFGETDPAAFVELAKTYGRAGIAVTTLGLGNEYNEDLLVQVADFSGGHYAYLDHPMFIAKVYGREVESLKTLVAKAAWLKIKVSPTVDISRVLGPKGYFLEGRLLTIPLGDFASGETRNVVLDLTVHSPGPAPDASSSPPPAGWVVEASVSYRNPSAEDQELQTQQSLNIGLATSGADQFASRDAAVEEIVEGFTSSLVLEKASALVALGQRHEAKEMLLEQAQRIRERPGQNASRSGRLSQADNLEQTATALVEVAQDADSVSRFVKQQKFNAYQLAR